VVVYFLQIFIFFVAFGLKDGIKMYIYCFVEIFN